MDTEKILESVGSWGRYQLYHYTLICFAGLVGGAHTMMHIFHAAAPRFYCKDGIGSQNLTNNNFTSEDACFYKVNSTFNSTVTLPCKNWWFDLEEYGENMVTKVILMNALF